LCSLLLLRGTDAAERDAVLCTDWQRLGQTLPACSGFPAPHSSQVCQTLRQVHILSIVHSLLLVNKCLSNQGKLCFCYHWLRINRDYYHYHYHYHCHYHYHYKRGLNCVLQHLSVLHTRVNKMLAHERKNLLLLWPGGVRSS
jgi:hypothetical protein